MSLYVIVGLRISLDAEYRIRNAVACLRSLCRQTYYRENYKIVVVEQDTEMRNRRTLEALYDIYLFDEYHKAYNRSRAFNAGFNYVNPQSQDVVCFMDADLFVLENWIERAMGIFESHKTAALIPFDLVRYLDETSSTRLCRRRFAGKRVPPNLGVIKDGKSSIGGSIWIRAAFYRMAGGYDERYVGWGCEDQDFFIRLGFLTKIRRMSGAIYHLFHNRPYTQDENAVRNRELYLRTWQNKKGIFNPLGLEVL